MSVDYQVEPKGIDRVVVTLRLPLDSDTWVTYRAPAPADRRYSFSGSHLPFPSERAAYSEHINQGVVHVQRGAPVTIELIEPNAYYADANGTLVKPHLTLVYGSHVVHIPINQALPYRSLTLHPDQLEKGPLFFQGCNELASSQERLLLSRAFPAKNKELDCYWGRPY
jgi:hypothetical protein